MYSQSRAAEASSSGGSGRSMCRPHAFWVCCGADGQVSPPMREHTHSRAGILRAREGR